MIFTENNLTGTIENSQPLNANINSLANEVDPTVPSCVKTITEEDIAKWNAGGVDLTDYATKEYVDKKIINSLGGEY